MYSQLFKIIWETTANPGESLTQSCVEKYVCVCVWGGGGGGGFALYRIKFYQVIRKLSTILLVQEFCEPNHADHVIGHLAASCYKLYQLMLPDQTCLNIDGAYSLVLSLVLSF